MCYMVLNRAKCHFMLFNVKENEQCDIIWNDIAIDQRRHEKSLGVTIENFLSWTQ